MLNGLPLADDILDRFFTFCPNFPTLRSMILVSKDWHRVFETHPKSIVREVVCNIVGPALPQALRVIRYRYPTTSIPTEQLDPIVIATACPEDQSARVNAGEEQALQAIAKIVNTLEDIYSLTCKDRTSTTSVLTSDESWRFRRAAYRIMLYCSLFPGNRYSIRDVLLLGNTVRESIYAQRCAVLNRYSTTELQELFTVVKFMLGIFEYIDDDRLTVSELLLSTGPSGAVRVWESRVYDTLEDELGWGLADFEGDIPLFAGYFERAFNTIWADRNVQPPDDDQPISKWILDSVNGESDICSQCAVPGGVGLLNEANWFSLHLFPQELLKPKLINPTIYHPFIAWWKTQKLGALGPWITGIFAFRAAATTPHLHPMTQSILAHPSFAPFANWDVGLAYCETCLQRFLLEHVWVWWLEEQLKAGWIPPENCRYGYNCKIQGSKLNHAESRNHLCVPTHGTLL
ncbi:hypothetical protein C8R43DRAFT_357122 [Mycena crocata]|nr:hypothetical protein C8R43DRAFT_357122 [Mycena crocata]